MESIRHAKGDWETINLLVHGHFGDYPEPSALLEAFTCDHTANRSGFPVIQKYDELCNRSKQDGNSRPNRFALYQHAESILNESAAVMPLYHYNHTRLVPKYPQGFPPNNNPKISTRRIYTSYNSK
ncbi:hypothetical protein OH492_11100 [Vibrio chagasii]|nr:hypothetical protein [Vibrio chagasii]